MTTLSEMNETVHQWTDLLIDQLNDRFDFFDDIILWCTRACYCHLCLLRRSYDEDISQKGLSVLNILSFLHLNFFYKVC